MNHGATNLQTTEGGGGGGGETTLNSFLQVLLAHNHTFSLLHLVQKYTAIFPLRMDLRNQNFTKKHDRRSQIYSPQEGEKTQLFAPKFDKEINPGRSTTTEFSERNLYQFPAR
jgi:hypothetical protein